MRILINEFFIKINEIQKNLKFSINRRFRSFFYDLNAFFIHANIFCKNYKFQKLNFLNDKNTFFQIYIQSKFFEFLKHLTYMSSMLRRIIVVNQNIIQIHNANDINKFTQNFIDINLKNH